MKLIKAKIKEWTKLSKEIRDLCIQYLIELLKKNNSKIYWEDIYLDESVTVSYDGGRHPEYASNVYSVVNGLFIDDNKIYLDIEDCSKYAINNITTEELCDLCYFLDSNKKELKKR